jgi:thioredoxin 1
MSSVITITSEEQFDEDVLGSDIPVIVDFWAEWCGPCKMISPVLEEVAATLEGQVKIVKVNVDTEGVSEIPNRFGIRGIPTLLKFVDGNVNATKVGAISKLNLIKFINE